MDLIVFEDERLEWLGPLTALRHTSQLRWGTKSLIDSALENTSGGTEAALWGRPELADVMKESTEKHYNERVEGSALFVNARARPHKSLFGLTAKKTPFMAFSEGQLVAAMMPGSRLTPGVIGAKTIKNLGKEVDRLEVPSEALFSGYWDLVESNGLAIAEQARHFEDTQAPPMTAEVRGPLSGLMIHGSAELGAHVAFDTRPGPVVVEEGAIVESFSRISGPSYVGPKTRLCSAQIGGGTSIFEGCKVGGEVDNSIIMSHTNKAHTGYVGDTYLGEWVNVGAGSNFSNLKNTYGNVRLQLGEEKTDSGMLKLGPVVGDMSKLSIGAMVYAGKMLGTGCQVAGVVSRNIPAFSYLGPSGKLVELRLDSVVETQRRMMERRGMNLTRAAEALIRRTFKATSKDRTRAGVRKGSLA